MSAEERRVAIVTGAGGGVGRATAKLFAAAGWAVVAADLDAAGVEQTVAEIGAEGGEALASVTDISDPDRVEAMVALAVDTYGGLDAAVNNAAIPQVIRDGRPAGTPLHEMSREEWDRVVGINLSGTFFCLQSELRAMRASGRGGAIVNVSSASAVRALEGLGAYIPTKKGVFGLTEVAAVENGRHGIRVNTVIPGNVTETKMSFLEPDAEQAAATAKTFAEVSPLERGAVPSELGEAILWLCTDGASYVTGTSLLVDGGTTVRHPASKEMG
ncbi:MAG: SDR family NAD(P)-dependent oxidoreductase [Solirubrobacterales bacterium]